MSAQNQTKTEDHVIDNPNRRRGDAVTEIGTLHKPDLDRIDGYEKEFYRNTAFPISPYRRTDSNKVRL